MKLTTLRPWAATVIALCAAPALVRAQTPPPQPAPPAPQPAPPAPQPAPPAPQPAPPAPQPAPPAPQPAPPAPQPAPPAPQPAPPAPQPAPGTPTKPGDAKPGEPAKPPVKPGTPKPYKEVITAEAKSDPGVFTVHRIDDKIYYEIPADALNREMLWTTEIAKLPAGFGYGGTAVGDRVVRWTRRNNKVYLRAVSYQLRGDGKTAIQRAVDDASLEPIIQAFDVEAEGKDKSAVIDVTRLLTSDVSEFAVKRELGAAGVDPSRSYVDKVKAFPTNIEARSVLTFTLGPPTPNPFGPPRPFGVSSVTALIHYSMTLLPAKPMQGRYYDSRVGYFTEGFEDYGTNENRVKLREYVTRYRLEKKDPSAALSEPVKPIVYYISREVPEQWHPYMKQAVEDWNVAFEQAGFKNAIQCKDAPSEKDEPDWDPEDARYSVIRWAPNAIENAMGPHVHDPRSGEIISAHIIVWHDVLKLVQDWYFVQCGPLDPRAKTLPLPEPLIGELLRVVVAHEVGHTLGLRHNHKASSSYTVAQLRNKAFTEKYGDEASIMDYGRFNYVAQPGDNARLMPKLGPYDLFAIEWGYVPIAGATTPDGEKSALDAIASRQIADPMLRFGGESFNASVDPTVQTEDLGSDPIEATTYGLQNIRRVAAMLIPATTKFGEDYSLLQETYDSLLFQKRLELNHVAKLVGGMIEMDYHAGRGAQVFRPVPKAKQAQAVQFLVANAFTTPKEFLNPDLLYRISPAGAADTVLNSQRSVLASLLSENRVKRMLESQALSAPPSYTVEALISDVQKGVWSELTLPEPTIDLYRRNLQRSYLRYLKPRLVGDGASQSDFRPIAIGALRDLDKSIVLSLGKVKNPVVALHLKECRKDIEDILNPKFAPSSAPVSLLSLLGLGAAGTQPPAPQFPGCFERDKGVNAE